MDSRSKRLMQTALNKAFRLFSVDFEYSSYLGISDTNNSDDGFGSSSTSEDMYGNWETVHELLSPVGGSANSTLANQLQMLSGGNAERYTYEWISKIDVPLKSKIRYKGKVLHITKKTDYSEMVGFFVYLIKDRSDDNG